MKLRKKKDPKRDQFVDTVEKILKWALAHRDRAITIVAGIIIVIVVGYWLVTPRKNYSSEAELLLFQGKELISIGRFDEAEQILTYLTQNFSNTSSGTRGHYYLGIIHSSTVKFDDAILDFDRFLNSGLKNSFLWPSALVGRGGSKEAKGDLEGAYEDYKAAANIESPVSKIARLQWGRVAGFIGKIDEAKEVLNAIIEEEDGTSLADDAKLYLSMIESR